MNVDSIDAFLERMKKFVNSTAFRVILIIILVLAVFLLLRRLYISLRNKRLSNLIYERSFSESGVYEGECVELVETIRNAGFFPLFGVDVESYIYNELELEEYESDGKGGMQYIISRFNLLPYMQIKRRHTVNCVRRGHYRLQVATIYGKKGPITLNAPAEIYVFPKIMSLDLRNLAASRLQGNLASMRPLYTDPFSFSGIRDYRFGDRLSQVNFKASAKTMYEGYGYSSLKVNVNDFCASRKMMIYIDFHLPMGSKIDGKKYNLMAEQALRFCASIINEAIFGGYAVGLAANCKTYDGELSVRYACESGTPHMIDMLRELASINPVESSSFAALLDRAVSEAMSDTEILIICYDRAQEALLKLSLLERRGNSVQFIVLDPESAPDEMPDGLYKDVPINMSDKIIGANSENEQFTGGIMSGSDV